MSDNFFQIIARFPVLEHPIMVYRGDTVKWRTNNHKNIEGVASTSLSRRTAIQFINKNRSSCCLLTIMLLPGIRVLFLIRYGVIVGYIGGGHESEIIVVTSNTDNEFLIYTSGYQNNNEINSIVTGFDADDDNEKIQLKIHTSISNIKITKGVVNNNHLQHVINTLFGHIGSLYFFKMISASMNNPGIYNELITQLKYVHHNFLYWSNNKFKKIDGVTKKKRIYILKRYK